MLLHPDRLRNCSFGILSPPVLCELASYFKGGSREASGRVDLLGPPTPRAMCPAGPLLQHVYVNTFTLPALHSHVH